MTIKEMMDKTKIVIIGLCKGVNEYHSQKNNNIYYSVDVEVQGTKNPINIKLPPDYDRNKLVEYDLVQLNCSIRPGFEGKGIEIRAI